MDRPAAPTLDGQTLRRYHYWTGRSGRAYAHSVFTPAERPHFACSALVMVATDAGRRSIVGVAATGPLPELYFNGQAYARALVSGVSEIHVHFANDARTARVVAADIARQFAQPCDDPAGARPHAAELA